MSALYRFRNNASYLSKVAKFSCTRCLSGAPLLVATLNITKTFRLKTKTPGLPAAVFAC